METTNLNLAPANEIELRLICLNMAVEIVKSGNIDNTTNIVESAGKLYEFATNSGKLVIKKPADITDAIAPLMRMFLTEPNVAKSACSGKCGENKAPAEELPVPEVKTKKN